LPEILAEVESRVERIKEGLSKLPTKLTGDPTMTVINMITTFRKDVELLVKGRPEAGKAGLIQNIRRSKETFRETIFRQAPEFKAFEKPATQTEEPTEPSLEQLTNELRAAGTPREVAEEELEPKGRRNPKNFVYMDEVLDRAQESVPLSVARHMLTSLQRYHPRASQPLSVCGQ
jgi:hypothetical protein